MTEKCFDQLHKLGWLKKFFSICILSQTQFMKLNFFDFLSFQNARSIEAAEEAKLKARFPQGMVGRPAAGHSAFLQKRLGKGVRGSHWQNFS